MEQDALAESQVVRTAAALIIGSELLSGKIRDENIFELGQTLRSLGIEFHRVIICRDERSTIAADLRHLLAHHDVVFTSGGLGPTHDDVTVNGVCDALGVAAEVSPEMTRIIQNIYGQHTTDIHLLMARVPPGTELVDTGGWPLMVAGRVWMLPGVPELFRSKLASIKLRLRGPSPFFSSALRISALEATVKEQLDVVVAAYPAVDIGSYPKWFDANYKTLITLDSRSEQELSAAHQHLLRLLEPYVIPSP